MTPYIGYARLFNGWYMLASPVSEEIFAERKSLLTLLSILFGVAILLVLILSVLMGFSIAKPIQTVNGKMEAIAKGGGDLTDRLEVLQKDETGRLALHFSSFVESLAGMIKRIQGAHGESGEVKEALVEGTSNAQGSVENIRTQVAALLTDIEQFNNQISEVSSASFQISGNLDSFNSQIDN